MKFFGVWAAFLSISYFLAGQGMPGGSDNNVKSPPLRIYENPIYISGWAENAPAIDGVINAGEWATSLQLNIADNYTGEPVKLLLMNDWHNLYIGIIDFNDSTGIGGSDEIGLYFDLNRDGDRKDYWILYLSDPNEQYVFDTFAIHEPDGTPVQVLEEGDCVRLGDLPLMVYRVRERFVVLRYARIRMDVK